MLSDVREDEGLHPVFLARASVHHLASVQVSRGRGQPGETGRGRVQSTRGTCYLLGAGESVWAPRAPGLHQPHISCP